MCWKIHVKVDLRFIKRSARAISLSSTMISIEDCVPPLRHSWLLDRCCCGKKLKICVIAFHDLQMQKKSSQIISWKNILIIHRGLIWLSNEQHGPDPMELIMLWSACGTWSIRYKQHHTWHEGRPSLFGWPDLSRRESGRKIPASALRTWGTWPARDILCNPPNLTHCDLAAQWKKFFIFHWTASYYGMLLNNLRMLQFLEKSL